MRLSAPSGGALLRLALAAAFPLPSLLLSQEHGHQHQVGKLGRVRVRGSPAPVRVLVRVEPVQWERLTGVADSPGGPEGSHALAMASSGVDGVRLT